MVAEMEFCLLGPLMVRNGGTILPVTARRQRAVLATLLLNAGRVVGPDELAEVLWGSRLPRTARVSVQNYVMRLRNALGEAGRTRIRTLPGGYLISVLDGELDVSQFEALLDASRTAARERSWTVAEARADQALSLWRGEPMADLGSELLALRQLPPLTELRLTAVEIRLEARLHLGRYAEAIGELRRLAAEQPMRERVHGLLMQALYRDGRQAEALEAYRQARRVLVAELGTEPGAVLRELHQRILTGDSLDAPAGIAALPMPPARDELAPRQLPPGVRHFTGRAGELTALSGLADQAGRDGPGMVVISAIGGTAGVGKTALAIHWAQRVADRFPDGQLYMNLRGYDPKRPMPPTDALAAFLRALGVPGPDIPAGEQERTALYRSLLAGRRTLVLLDNAGSAEQVRPLLPSTAGCMAVVTSRDTLAGLVARDGAVRLYLDLLPLPEAAQLLCRLIGPRARADPGATDALAWRCARLPLALRVAAELAAARPADSLADLVAELADRQQRLDLLEAGGDRQTAVRTVFSWSYRGLDAAAAKAFRLAGLHPGPDFDAYAIAALTGLPAERALRALDRLTQAQLIQPTVPGRYGLHDLLCAYASELATVVDGRDECHAALTRLLHYYLFAAAAAMDAILPAESDHRPRIPPPASPVPSVNDPAEAASWLDAHRSSLVAAAVHASGDHEWSGHTTRLAATLYRYLDLGGYTPEAVTMHTCARRAARRVGDQAAEAVALTSLSATDWRQGRYQRAIRHLRQAVTLFRSGGDSAGEARALGNLGLIQAQRGRYQQAVRHQRQVLTLYRTNGDQAGQAHALCSLGELSARQGRYPQAVSQLQLALDLCRQAASLPIEPYILINLGDIDLRQGRYEQAADHTRRALDLCRQAGDRAGEASCEANLGDIELRQGHYQQAVRHLRQALATFRQSGERANEAYVLASLGDLDLRQGRPEQASRNQRHALSLFTETGDQSGEVQALNGLGEALLANGQSDDARGRHTTALDLARKIGDRYQMARAHEGLGNAWLAIGDHHQAQYHRRLALTFYTRLGAPEAGQIRASLRNLAVGPL